MTALTCSEFHVWVQQSKPGAQLVYHEGHLAVDRESWNRQSIMLDVLATDVLHFAEAGWLHLVQKRVGPSCWHYIAVRA